VLWGFIIKGGTMYICSKCEKQSTLDEWVTYTGSQFGRKEEQKNRFLNHRKEFYFSCPKCEEQYVDGSYITEVMVVW
jgi:transcription initiation factor IIE alpha subunit